MLLLLLTILLSTAAFAQPQAPIEWGPIRLLMEADSEYHVDYIYAQGDTIALTAVWGIDQGWDTSPAVCISGDNGQTWSPWHVFPYPGAPDYYNSEVGFTGAGLVCCTYTTQFNRSFYLSTDLGMTWNLQSPHVSNLVIMGARGDTILCMGTRRGAVTWTTDGGITFAPQREITWWSNGSIEALALSQGLIHAVGRSDPPNRTLLTVYSHGPFWAGDFTPLEIMNEQVYFSERTDMAFDEAGVGVMASVVNYTAPIPDWGAVLVNTTRDNGLTWSEPDTFTARETADPFTIFVRQCGPLWVVVWGDSTTSPGLQRGGFYYRFSANQAQSWYPGEQAQGDSIFGGGRGDVVLESGRISLYAALAFWNGVHSRFFFQWDGTIHPDTMPPVIANATAIDSVVMPDATVTFSCTAGDNDSLWRMDVVLREAGSPDSLILPLQRGANSEYATDWVIPADSAEWFYYYRAEDMWEHAAFMPSDGSQNPWRFRVQPLAADDPFIAHRSSFIVSLFPNPSNSAPRIELSPDWFTRGAVTIAVFNILGEQVWQSNLARHRDVISIPPLPTGVYFMNARSRTHSASQKFLILR